MTTSKFNESHFDTTHLQKTNFLKELIEQDLQSGKVRELVTRFPPEPNGYLHIGHARNIYLNHHFPAEYGGRFHLRMDDTNPAKERQEYVDNIQKDIQWLGFDWGDHYYLASSYFDRFFECAEHLARTGLAYVCFLTEEQVREQRGTVMEPGKPSPWRDSAPEENLALLRKMRAGEYADGECTLRAKIDMGASNMKLRDPPLYRVRHVPHQHTGDAWCIYPMYDFAHPLSDAFENITHSICTLEFQDNRALYDWVIEYCPVESTPHQYEVARMNLNYTITSKRKLLQLVEEGHVSGWDDPRMPTLAGLRRRGIRPEAIRHFCRMSGISKSDSVVDMGILENVVREDLDAVAPRVMAVLKPLKVTLTNFSGPVVSFDAPLWPPKANRQENRSLQFGDTLYIEESDFSLNPPSGWRRLSPGGRVRLRFAFTIQCDEVIEKDGKVVELLCSYAPDSKGQKKEPGVKGIIHWVSEADARPAEFRLFDRLFTVPFPGAGEADFLQEFNPNSLSVTTGFVEANALILSHTRFQFERQGYFGVDSEDSSETQLVYNRIVTLRDSWAKPKQQVTQARQTKQINTPRKEIEIPSELQPIFDRYVTELKLKENVVHKLVTHQKMREFFEQTIAAGADPTLAARWLTNELKGVLGSADFSTIPFSPSEYAKFIGMTSEGTLGRNQAKKVLQILVNEGGDPADIAKAQGFEAPLDKDTLAPVVAEFLAAHPEKVAQFRAGNSKILGFFIGQLMKKTRGGAPPKLLQALLTEHLK